MATVLLFIVSIMHAFIAVIFFHAQMLPSHNSVYLFLGIAHTLLAYIIFRRVQWFWLPYLAVALGWCIAAAFSSIFKTGLGAEGAAYAGLAALILGVLFVTLQIVTLGAYLSSRNSSTVPSSISKAEVVVGLLVLSITGVLDIKTLARNQVALQKKRQQDIEQSIADKRGKEEMVAKGKMAARQLKTAIEGEDQQSVEAILSQLTPNPGSPFVNGFLQEAICDQDYEPLLHHSLLLLEKMEYLPSWWYLNHNLDNCAVQIVNLAYDESMSNDIRRLAVRVLLTKRGEGYLRMERGVAALGPGLIAHSDGEHIVVPAIIAYLEQVNANANYDSDTSAHVDAILLLTEFSHNAQVINWLNEKKTDPALDSQLRERLFGYWEK
jgi:hypothetical protein